MVALAIRSVARRRPGAGFAALRHARRPGADAANRLQRIMELEILDALCLQLLGGRGEARVGLFVLFEQRVVDLFLVNQVPSQVAFAERGTRGIVGEIGRAQVRNPVTTAQLVSRLLLEKKKTSKTT